MTHHPTQQIPLCDLHSTEEAVRVTPAMEQAHDELVASIKAHGLLEPLVVRAGDGSDWNVVAGNRRLSALLAIVQHGELPADAKINCSVLQNGTDDLEASVAENTVRVAMHPADQARAFRRIADAGATAEDIGIRFGLPRRTVEQRLRLGRLADPIMEAYRTGEIDTDLAQAYASTANTDRQLAAWNKLKGQQWGHHQNAVHDLLEQDQARSDSPIAAFVGAKVYTLAGGAAESTLFADYNVLTDIDLLEKLAKEKLERIAERERRKGWKWVEIATGDFDMYEINKTHTRLYPDPGIPTPEESATIAEAERYFTEHNSDNTGEDLTDEEEAEWKRHEEAFDKVRDAEGRRRAFTPEQIAAAGVIVYVERNGKTGKVEGLVKAGDHVPGRDDGKASSSGQNEPKTKGYSQGVKESIAELRNGVLRAELLSAPDVARDLLTFSLILSSMTGWIGEEDGGGFYPHLPLALRLERPERRPVQGASDEIKGYLADPKLDLPWFDPKQPLGVLFESYRKLDAETKDNITTQVVASCLFTIPGGELTNYDTHAAIETELSPGFATQLLEVDADLWSAETFWARLRKDQIVAEAQPCLGEEWAKEALTLKKGELAEGSAQRMKLHPEWLPQGFYAAERPEAD